MTKYFFTLALLIATIGKQQILDSPIFTNDDKYNDYTVKDITNDYSNYWSIYENQLRTIIADFDDLDGTYIAFAKPIKCLYPQKEVVYIDFVYDYGFAVLDELYIYEHETNVDLSSMHLSNFVYDTQDKFLLLNDDGYYEKIFSDDYHAIVSQNQNVLSAPVLHQGQSHAGDGQIADLDAYVQDRYPGYTISQINYMTNYHSMHQTENSIYKRILYKQGTNPKEYFTTLSEGNCSISSMLSFIYNLSSSYDHNGFHRQYYPNLANGFYTVDYSTAVNSDALFSSYGSGNWKTELYHDVYYDAYWEKEPDANLSSINNLYLQIRSLGIQAGYLPDIGLSPSYFPGIISSIATSYGYAIPLIYDSSTTNVKMNIHIGLPSLISVYGSETYRDHAMCTYGYATYSKVNSDNTIEYLHFWMVDSGWNNFVDSLGNTICWYDANVPGATALFTAVNYTSLNWPGC